ncbi:MAG: BtpA/SgcQ family protein [Chloroflexi bacterium]|nr:BtpA/SgcQ family protein [Chloroflexota bacterium]MCC6894512.1 BtpA/SgcQ family protein [Anaerolineae bacterium]
MIWLKDLFHTEKPIIAMCHLKAMPGDPGYDAQGGMEAVVDSARENLLALQAGGVDAVMFSNEASLPYLTKVETITTACMARVITELRPEIRVPFGVNVLWDPAASIDLAVATGGQFVREIFTGVYASDYGMWNTNCGEIIRHQYAVHGQHVKLLFNIVPESAVYMAERHIVDIAKSTVFVSKPDALCVSGITAGAEASLDTLRQVKAAVPETVVLANTGVRLSNVDEMLAVADGAIVGTTFKRDGYIWNDVDTDRVKAFMDKVHTLRG